MFIRKINNLQKTSKSISVIFDFRLHSKASDTMTHESGVNGDIAGVQGRRNDKINVRNVKFILSGIGGPN
jgi:hypothetical protein